MFAFALSPLSPYPHHTPMPHTPIPKPLPTPHPSYPTQPTPQCPPPHTPTPRNRSLATRSPHIWSYPPRRVRGRAPHPLSFGSLPTFSRSQIVRNAAFSAVFSHFLRHSRKIFTNFCHLATASQRPTRATPYKGDLPFFFGSVFSLAFFIVGTRHRSLIDDFPIKSYCLMVNRMTECVIIGGEKSHSMQVCNVYE